MPPASVPPVDDPHWTAALRKRLAEVDDPVALVLELFAHAPVGCQIYGADGHSLATNRAFRDLFGAEPPPGYDVFRDEAAEAAGITAQIRRAFEGETVQVGPFSYDPRHVRHVQVEEGREVCVTATFVPLRAPSGGVAHVAVVFQDLTAEEQARRAAEAGRAEAEAAGRRATFLARATSLLGASLDPTETLQRLAVVVRSELRADCVVLLEDAGGRLVRVAGSGSVYQAKVEFRPIDLAADATHPHAVAVREGRASLHHDWPALLDRVLPPDDPYARITRRFGVRQVIQAPLRGREGTIGLLVLLTVDPTRRFDEADLRLAGDLGARAGLAIENARLHARITQAEARWRLLLDATQHVLWTSGPDGAFTAPQPSWEAYTGQPWEQHEGFGWLEAVHPADRERLRARWTRAARHGAIYDIDGRLWHAASRTWHHFVVRAVPMRDADGQLREWVGAVLDVEREHVARARLQLLAEVSTAFSRAANGLEEALHGVARAVVQALGDFCAIALVAPSDPTRMASHTVAHRDPAVEARLTEILGELDPTPAADALSEQVFASGQPLLIAHLDPGILQAMAAAHPAYAPLIEQIGGHSYAAVPIISGGHTVGVLSVVRDTEAPPFGPEDVALLEELAARAELTLTSARLLEAQRRAVARLRTLARVSGHIAEQGTDAAGVARVLVDDVVDGVGDACTLRVLSEDGASLTLLAHADRATADEGTVLDPPSASLPVVGVHAEVLRRGQPARIRLDEPPSERLPRASGLRAFMEARRLHQMLLLPLVVSGEVLGVLALGRRGQRAHYDDDDLVLLSEVADRTALALARAREHEELERERERAEAANVAKDEFLALLGHELRNPLTPILTALQLLKLKADDAFVNERAIIERQAHHMVRLVDDLLDVSRITRGKIALSLRTIELAPVVARAVDQASPLLEARGHTLQVDVPASGLVVNADADRLAQVVGNLLVNAAKYTGPGGRIDVRAWQEEHEVVLAVRDTGVGIEPDLLASIFHVFVQGRRNLDRAEGGLGLGLSIVHNLTTLHGGRVSAHSEGPGKGSTFVVRLPRWTDGPTHAAEAPAAEPAPTSGAARVLVVDDNPDVTAILTEALGALGHHVRTAPDAPTALREVARHPFDVALLDIGLPGIDGYELARRLRALPAAAGLRLVAVTGYGQSADRARAIEAGFDEHLVKPVDLDRLDALVRALTERQA